MSDIYKRIRGTVSGETIEVVPFSALVEELHEKPYIVADAMYDLGIEAVARFTNKAGREFIFYDKSILGPETQELVKQAAQSCKQKAIDAHRVQLEAARQAKASKNGAVVCAKVADEDVGEECAVYTARNLRRKYRIGEGTIQGLTERRGFPKPILFGSSQRPHRRWLRAQVDAWFEAQAK